MCQPDNNLHYRVYNILEEHKPEERGITLLSPHGTKINSVKIKLRLEMGNVSKMSILTSAFKLKKQYYTANSI